MPTWAIVVIAVAGFIGLLWFIAFCISLHFGGKVFKEIREDFKNFPVDRWEDR